MAQKLFLFNDLQWDTSETVYCIPTVLFLSIPHPIAIDPQDIVIDFIDNFLSPYPFERIMAIKLAEYYLGKF